MSEFAISVGECRKACVEGYLCDVQRPWLPDALFPGGLCRVASRLAMACQSLLMRRQTC